MVFVHYNVSEGSILIQIHNTYTERKKKRNYELVLWFCMMDNIVAAYFNWEILIYLLDALYTSRRYNSVIDEFVNCRLNIFNGRHPNVLQNLELQNTEIKDSQLFTSSSICNSSIFPFYIFYHFHFTFYELDIPTSRVTSSSSHRSLYIVLPAPESSFLSVHCTHISLLMWNGTKAYGFI